MHYHSLFVSDIHLGTKACQVQYLLKFIHDNTFDRVFLLGDIVDIHAMKRKWYWTKDHNTFIQKILKMSRKDVKCVYCVGNHDDAIKEFIKDGMDFSFGDIKVCNEYNYKSISGKKFVLMHGDVFDGAIRSIGWLYWVGDHAYDIALSLNTFYNKIRRLFGWNYWSLSAYLKSKVKQAIEVFNRFDELAVRTCLVGSCDGMIYGHSHTPKMKTIKTKLILNTGDVVENLTCIVETINGEFQLINLVNGSVISSVN